MAREMEKIICRVKEKIIIDDMAYELNEIKESSFIKFNDKQKLELQKAVDIIKKYSRLMYYQQR